MHLTHITHTTHITRITQGRVRRPVKLCELGSSTSPVPVENKQTVCDMCVGTQTHPGDSHKHSPAQRNKHTRTRKHSPAQPSSSLTKVVPGTHWHVLPSGPDPAGLGRSKQSIDLAQGDDRQASMSACACGEKESRSVRPVSLKREFSKASVANSLGEQPGSQLKLVRTFWSHSRVAAARSTNSDTYRV